MPEDLENRITRARQMFAGPYNCAQAVASAYADIIGLDEEEIRRLVSGFGYGMGGEQSVCGALSGGVFVLSSTVKDPASRDELYQQVRDLIAAFRKENQGKMLCAELVGTTPTDQDFHTICPVLVEKVVRMVSSFQPGNPGGKIK